MYDSLGSPLTYQGSTLNVFPFWPNYKKDVIEQWEWATVILPAFDGGEQRAARRQYPRRFVEYEAFAQGTDAIALANHLWSRADRFFVVPDWNRGTTITLAMEQTSSGSTVRLGTHAFVAGDYVIGFSSPTSFELRQVQAVTSDSIVLDSPVSWVFGTEVYLANLGFFEFQQTLSFITPTLVSGQVSISLLADPNRSYNLPALNSYGGYYVWEDVLDQSSRSDVYNHKSQLVDFGTANPFIDVESTLPNKVDTVTFFLSGPGAIRQFINLINFCKGKLKPFWLPSGMHDLEAVSLSGATLTVKDVGYTQFVKDKQTKKYIQITYTTGDARVYQIFSSSVSGGTEILTLDSAPAFLATDIVEIAFVYLVRFDTDKIQLAYRTPTFATVQAPVKILKIT